MVKKNERRKGLPPTEKYRFILWGRTPAQLSGISPIEIHKINLFKTREMKMKQKTLLQKCLNFKSRIKKTFYT